MRTRQTLFPFAIHAAAVLGFVTWLLQAYR